MAFSVPSLRECSLTSALQKHEEIHCQEGCYEISSHGNAVVWTHCLSDTSKWSRGS